MFMGFGTGPQPIYSLSASSLPSLCLCDLLSFWALLQQGEGPPNSKLFHGDHASSNSGSILWETATSDHRTGIHLLEQQEGSVLQ